MKSIFQTSWDLVEIRSDYELVNSSAIQKTDSGCDLVSCRLLRLTSKRSETMEKVTRKLISFLHTASYQASNRTILGKQYGFMPGRSESLQLLRTKDDWTGELDKRIELDIDYIDSHNHFYSVRDQRLFGAIGKYDTQGKIPNWIRDLIFSRRQRVVNGNVL